MNWMEDAKVMLASATGISVQLANIELWVKILVGVATIFYIVTKTVKLWQNKKED